MNNFTFEETNLLCIYNTGRRVKNTHKDLMGRPDMPSHFYST